MALLNLDRDISGLGGTCGRATTIDTAWVIGVSLLRLAWLCKGYWRVSCACLPAWPVMHSFIVGCLSCLVNAPGVEGWTGIWGGATMPTKKKKNMKCKYPRSRQILEVLGVGNFLFWQRKKTNNNRRGDTSLRAIVTRCARCSRARAGECELGDDESYHFRKHLPRAGPARFEWMGASTSTKCWGKMYIA